MKRVALKRAWWRLAPLVGVSVPALAFVLASAWLASCVGPRPAPSRQRPLTYREVPDIRVLITPRPLERATLSTAAGHRLRVDGKTLTEGEGPLDETAVTRIGGTWRFNLLSADGRQVTLRPARGSIARVGSAGYRGRLRLLPVGQTRFIIINDLDMESYLAGVLARELYPTWSLETYRALAVAARTFALYHKLTFGESHEYDLGSTQSAQVYGGFSAETPKAWRAVRSTHGRVLTFGPEGDERIFMAQYSSCCGGWVNGAAVIRDAPDIEPLRGGQRCTDCAASARYRWDPVRISKSALHEALGRSYEAVAALAGVKELRVVQTTSYGRIVWVDVVSTQADQPPVRLRAEDVRLSLLRASAPGADKLYSMNCRLRDLGSEIEFYDGRGFGHGVGLCQWGAQGKALRGATAEEILSFYYPGAKIFRAY